MTRRDTWTDFIYLFGLNVKNMKWISWEAIRYKIMNATRKGGRRCAIKCCAFLFWQHWCTWFKLFASKCLLTVLIKLIVFFLVLDKKGDFFAWNWWFENSQYRKYDSHSCVQIQQLTIQHIEFCVNNCNDQIIMSCFQTIYNGSAMFVGF